MTQAPPPTPTPPPAGFRPHRGVTILVLGILGLIICFILGIVAWVMANGDLREMDAGRMDPEGRQLTQVGKILGIVAVAIQLLAFALWVLIVGLAGLGAAAGGP